MNEELIAVLTDLANSINRTISTLSNMKPVESKLHINPDSEYGSGIIDKKYWADSLSVHNLSNPLISHNYFTELVGDWLKEYEVLELSGRADLLCAYDAFRSRDVVIGGGRPDIITSEDKMGVVYQSFEQIDKEYKLIIVNQYLEFIENPIKQLRLLEDKLAADGLIIIVFRPWTSINGWFCPNDQKYKYQHLLQTFNYYTNVLTRVIDPLREYEEIIDKAKLVPLERRFFRDLKNLEIFDKYPEALDILIKRTWGDAIDPETAKQILAINFVVYKCESIW